MLTELGKTSEKQQNSTALLPVSWDNARSAMSSYLPRLPRDKAKRH